MEFKLTYTIPSQQPRYVAMSLAELTSQELMFKELIAWLPHATINEFLTDFAQHLEAGDFDDLLWFTMKQSNPKSRETRRDDIIVGILAVAMASMTAAAFLGFDITAKKPAVTPIEVIPYQHHH